jgi:Rod binding domain-containing protein
MSDLSTNTSSTYLDFNALTRLKGEAAQDPTKAIRKTSEQFEAYFIQQMMKTMRDSIEKSDLVEGLQAGADDYLTKPYDPQELEVRISVGKRILNLESELLTTLGRLKQSDKNRNEFISALTHDLRTPLAAERNARVQTKPGATRAITSR